MTDKITTGEEYNCTVEKGNCQICGDPIKFPLGDGSIIPLQLDQCDYCKQWHCGMCSSPDDEGECCIECDQLHHRLSPD